jgi:hypothetical protein
LLFRYVYLVSKPQSPPTYPPTPFYSLSLYRNQHSSKEERISPRIPPHSSRIVLLGIKLFPHARRENVLVAFVPPTIDDLGDVRIILEALEAFVGRVELATIFRLRGRFGEGVE